MRSSLADPLAVLVVDDDDQMLRTIGDLLTLRGYRSFGAATALKGLEVASHMDLPPAVALVDLRLPDMDGFELVGHLRLVSQLTEVVILTGNASLDSAVRALREQSYDYLVKPVQPEFLLQSVDRAAERWRRKSAEAAMHESQERLRRIFEHVGDALLIATEDGDIVEANPAACQLAGRDVDALRALTVRDALGLRDADPASSPGRPHGVLPSGEYRVKQASAIQVLDVRSAAFVPGMIAYSVRDLTAQRRLEEELHQSRKMDAIGRLAGGVAHDFNNVLTAITCYSEILLGAFEESDDRRTDVLEIKKAARRAASLTGQLLAFSRRQVLQPRILDLHFVVDDMQRMLARMIGEDVHLTIRHDDGPQTVRADPGQLGQVVMNLAVNARDAMPSGGELTLETGGATLETPLAHALGAVPPGEYATLRVTDSGHGMSDAVLAHLYEPFFTTKEQGRGTGLGLSTVYGIVSQSAGHITVTSTEGVGTTFMVYLPRIKERESEQDASATPAVATSGHETILFVEDDVAVRALVVRVLEAHGYHVLAAADAKAALAEAAAHKGDIHLLVTDVVMPGWNGRELADRLSEARPGMRVLYLSGYADDALLRRGITTRHTWLLQKPFDTAALLGKIQEALETPLTAR
ncbi:MAG TPA: response regulator [Gemmatimonadaceae bacterium]|nr:response regulator [Gemmatimonadaceae bacterium]